MSETDTTHARPESGSYNREALHEAGHVWVAAALGLPLSEVEFHPEQGRGRVSFSFGGSIRGEIRKRRHSRELRVVGNAGYAAEGVLWGLYAPGDSPTDPKVYDQKIIERIIPLLRGHLGQVVALAQYLYAQGKGVFLREKEIRQLIEQGLLPQPLSREERASLKL